MATTTNLDSLVINYLTQAQYDEAAQAGTLNANQLYLTPDTGGPTGTLSSVGVSNATNGGLTISGSPLTSDGTITIGHSNVLSSAQTTQAVYPIKIDKNGHISAYGSAVTISDTKVTQNYSTASGGHPILMTPEANISSTSSRGDTTAILTNAIYATPSTGNLQATTFNGYTLAAASAKAVDTSISAASTSTNLPTSAAVASFVEGKGYITSADVPEGASAYTGTISAVGTTASNGTNNGFARGDHVHNITSATINTVLGTGSGTAKFYREDGTWATPAYKTSATSSTTGITASTTANTTSVSGSDSFNATVTSHVLSFSHSAKTVSTSSATVTITDNGHTHTLS